MPSFQDSIFLAVLALLLFGPKRLPALARELGKWVGEFRRASNEFKMQMEDELRQSEQAERLKKIEAMEAAAPAIAALPETAASTDSAADEPSTITGVASEEPAPVEEVEAATPLPIAEEGEVKIMPPSTGLPRPRSRNTADTGALSGLLDSIPAAEKNEEPAGSQSIETAESAHGH